MSSGHDREPGPARRALFQDVPYILDSLWRRMEFKANRIGRVDFEKTHELGFSVVAVRVWETPSSFAAYSA